MFTEVFLFAHLLVNAVLNIDQTPAYPKAVQNPRSNNNDNIASTSRKRKSREEEVEEEVVEEVVEERPSRRKRIKRMFERRNNRCPSPLRQAHRPRRVKAATRVPRARRYTEASGAPAINIDNLSAEEIGYVMRTKEEKGDNRSLHHRQRYKENAVQRQARHSVESVYNHARKSMRNQEISLQKQLVHRKLCEKMHQ